ncbi:MAG: DEAD/DEAH box helicase [Oscillospiraceae bacterium]|jgi:ATP-dependent RNA helicase DeaD
MGKKLFSEINLSAELLRAIEAVSYNEMTEIQEKAIPEILEGHDVVGRSGTGTGKTAAFGIPAIERISGNPRKPQVIILSPTRELALQTSTEMAKFAAFKSSIRIATVFGGQSMMIQINQLRSANIVIGTPGRIMDHLNRGTLKLDEIKTLILDEADEMLNMGFLDDIRFILTSVPKERQTLLFSATMPPQILKLTKEFQNNPVMVHVDKENRMIDTIAQYYYEVPPLKKRESLNLLLQMYGSNRSVVFCNTKAMVDELVEYLNDNGFKSAGLHGDMRQNVRTQVMDSFRSGKLRILIATDVAARGIDVENVKAVFNYDIPQENEYYIHRIGRTGRAGKSGSSHTLVSKRVDVSKIKEIERFIKMPITHSPIPTYDDVLKKKRAHFENKIIAAIEKGIDEKWLSVRENLSEKGYSDELVICALMGMTAETNMQVIPVLPAAPGFSSAVQHRNDQQSSQRNDRTTRTDGTTCVRVNIGKNKNIAPNFILGAIIEATSLPSGSIGKINIHDDHTDIQVTRADAEVIVNEMKNKKIRSVPVKFEIVGDFNFSGTNSRPRGRSSGGKHFSGDKAHGFSRSSRKSPYSR